MRWYRVKFITGREHDVHGVLWTDTERTVDIRAESNEDAKQKWRDAVHNVANEFGFPSNIYVYESEEID